MKKLLTILLSIISLFVSAQVTSLTNLDDVRKVDWKFYVEGVQYINDSTWIVYATPYDMNDPGAETREVGRFVKDYISNVYRVIESTSTTLTLRDLQYKGIPTSPQQDQIARCYESLNEGDTIFYAAGATNDFQLDEASRWRGQAINDELLAQAIIAPKDSIIFTLTHDNIYWQEGVVFYDTTSHSLSYFNDEAEVLVNIGLENIIRVYNNNSFSITNGQFVYPDPNTGIGLADNREFEKSTIIAVVTHSIEPYTWGWVTKFGQVHDLNTSSFIDEQTAYLGENGGITHIKPTGGRFISIVGAVSVVSETAGVLTVDITSIGLTAEVMDFTGWPDQDDNSFPDNVGISLDANTRTLILTATPEDSYYYYEGGAKYIFTADTFQWSNIDGIHLMYYNGENIEEIVNPTDAQSSLILRQHAGIVNLYWSIPQNDYIYVNNEFHTFDMNGQTKAAFYDIHGCTVIDPITLTDFDVDGTGNLNSNAQFGNAAGRVRNQDLETYTPSTPSTTGYTIFYREGTAAWRSASNPGYGVVNTGTGRIAYNQNVGGVHSLAEATNGSYVPYYLLVSNTLGLKYGMVPGDNQYANPDDAVAGALQKIPGFLQNLPIKAIASLAIVVYQTRDNYSNAVKGRIVSVTNPLTDQTVEYIDLTEPGIIGGGVGGTGMQTLTDDPNGQPSYAGYGGSFITVNDAETGWEFTPTSFTETDPIFSAWDKDYNDLINKPSIPSALWNSNTDGIYTTSRVGIGGTPSSTYTLKVTGNSQILGDMYFGSPINAAVYQTGRFLGKELILNEGSISGTVGSGQGALRVSSNNNHLYYIDENQVQYDLLSSVSGSTDLSFGSITSSSFNLLSSSGTDVTFNLSGISASGNSSAITLTATGGDSSLWTDATTHIYRNSKVSVGKTGNGGGQFELYSNLPGAYAMDIVNADSESGKGMRITGGGKYGGFGYGILVLNDYTGTTHFQFLSDGSFYAKNLATATTPTVLYIDDSTGKVTKGAAPSGSGVSLGTNRQIPYMNSGGTDFLYSSNLTFDGNNLYAKPASYYYRDHLGANALLMESNYIYFYRDARLYNGATSTSTKTGSMYFDTDDNTFRGYNGTTWVDLGAAGGGSGTVTSVSAGNGMNFSTITTSGAVTLGTPSSITSSSTNSVSATSHTHLLADNSITNSKIADDAVTSSKIIANAVGASEIASGAVGIPKINATGTPSSTTYLRGDGSWSGPSIRFESTSTVILSTDYVLYFTSGTGSGQTVSFPSASSSQNRVIIICNASSNTISISNDEYRTFSTIVVQTSIPANSSVTLISNGSTWYQIQ